MSTSSSIETSSVKIVALSVEVVAVAPAEEAADLVIACDPRTDRSVRRLSNNWDTCGAECRRLIRRAALAESAFVLAFTWPVGKMEGT